jgi:serine/threonine protein kinase
MIGTKIGQYRVLRLLGEGGMGRVLLVEHALIGTRHALKLLHAHLSSNEMIAQRFINEARAAGAIGHRNVVEITHVDQLEGGGPWYLVMKYLEGQTLARFMASRRGPIEQCLIVHIIGEALNGLQAAHDRRIIHRDLKPDNLYLTSVKDDPYRTILLDFGVAQLGQAAGVLTRSGAVIGTPMYMAPEQHRGAPSTPRADIWAMAAIVYEMATGRLPYQGDDTDRDSLTAQSIFHRMMTVPVVDPRYYNPSLTEAFAGATLMALHPDPARRVDSACALARMLAEATPADTHGPSGIQVLKRFADELIADHVVEVPPSQSHKEAAAPRATVVIQDAPAPSAQLPDTVPAHVPAAMSTLGLTASQSFSRARRTQPRRPWLVAAIAVGTAALACAVASIVLVTLRAPPAPAGSTDHVLAAAPADAPADVRIASVVAPADAMLTSETVPEDAAGTAPPTHAASAPVPANQAGTAQAANSTSVPGQAPVLSPVPPPAAKHRDVAAAKAANATAAKTGNASAAKAVDTTTARAVGKERTAVTTGELSVVILPWAEVWLDGKPLGQTPVRAKVPIGTHRVRLKNDVKEKSVTITVTASRTVVIDESW